MTGVQTCALPISVYKIASFEIVDIPLIEYTASKGKPIIMSTGMATFDEIKEAVEAVKRGGAEDLALLKCTSAYPAKAEEMNLKTIPNLSGDFNVIAGLSDHTPGITVPVASVALGASIIEKHFTLSRVEGGPDAAFSLEPDEFKAMAEAVRTTEKALGTVTYNITPDEVKSRVFRRSLFAVKDIREGEIITEENIRSIRPAFGLPPKYLKDVLGKKARKNIKCGTPMSWDLLQ